MCIVDMHLQTMVWGRGGWAGDMVLVSRSLSFSCDYNHKNLSIIKTNLSIHMQVKENIDFKINSAMSFWDFKILKKTKEKNKVVMQHCKGMLQGGGT